MYASRSVFEPTQSSRESESGTRALRRGSCGHPPASAGSTHRRQRQAGALLRHDHLHASAAGAAGDRRRGRRRGLFMFTRRGGETPAADACALADVAAGESVGRHAEAPAQQNAPAGKTAAPSPDKGEAGQPWPPAPVQGARREEDRRDPVLEQEGRRRPQREGVGRPPARTATARSRCSPTGQEPRELHAHHDWREVTPDARGGGREPRGQAEVLTGYHDFQTINQFVSNASGAKCSQTPRQQACSRRRRRVSRPALTHLYWLGGCIPSSSI